MPRFSALQNADTDTVHKTVRDNAAKTGVLITNLGTPDAPTAAALRPYLAEFLSDPRVIEIPRIIWKVILHGIILRVRPAKSARLYQSIWTEAGSPLLAISEHQRDKLQQQLGDTVSVKLGMRYGNPSIAKALREFQDQGIRKIIVLPLYPQYGAPTTGSTFDAIATEMMQWRWVPELHFINAYFDHPAYISALAESVDRHIKANGMPDKIVFSYHGMPKSYLEKGDPYYCHSVKTTRLIKEALNLDDKQVQTTFQSRFGKAEWLQPYTDVTLQQLAQEGIRHIAVVCPAFSVDCLETLEEIAVENRTVFLEAGGETFHYIPALNDTPEHIQALNQLIKPHIHQ